MTFWEFLLWEPGSQPTALCGANLAPFKVILQTEEEKLFTPLCNSIVGTPWVALCESRVRQACLLSCNLKSVGFHKVEYEPRRVLSNHPNSTPRQGAGVSPQVMFQATVPH